MGFRFFLIGSGDLREYTLLVLTGGLVRAGSDGGFSESRRIPEFCLGFPGAFHRTVLLYYGRQVSKVCYVTATYGVEDSLVRAIFAKNEIASSSRQSLTLLITRRNLAQ